MLTLLLLLLLKVMLLILLLCLSNSSQDKILGRRSHRPQCGIATDNLHRNALWFITKALPKSLDQGDVALMALDAAESPGAVHHDVVPLLLVLEGGG